MNLQVGLRGPSCKAKQIEGFGALGFSRLGLQGSTVLGVCQLLGYTVKPIKLETGLRPNSAEIPYTVLLRIEAIGFPTFGLLL